MGLCGHFGRPKPFTARHKKWSAEYAGSTRHKPSFYPLYNRAGQIVTPDVKNFYPKFAPNFCPNVTTPDERDNRGQTCKNVCPFSIANTPCVRQFPLFLEYTPDLSVSFFSFLKYTRFLPISFCWVDYKLVLSVLHINLLFVECTHYCFLWRNCRGGVLPPAVLTRTTMESMVVGAEICVWRGPVYGVARKHAGDRDGRPYGVRRGVLQGRQPAARIRPQWPRRQKTRLFDQNVTFTAN